MQTIVTLIKGPGLGDFMTRAAVAAFIKIKAPDSRVVAIVCPNSRDQATSLNLFPYIDYLVYGKPGIPLDFFIDCSRFPIGNLPASIQGGPSYPPTPGLAAPFPLFLGYFDFLPCWPELKGKVIARIPDQIAATSEEQLIAMGLDRNRWFMCLHLREGGYRQDGHLHPRNVLNKQPYIDLIKHIVHHQGGQVVRLGDPSMEPFPAMEGLIDLSVMPDSVLVQAFAVSRSRYLLCSPSGPGIFANLFNVPSAVTNFVGYDTMKGEGVFQPEKHIISTKTFILDNGRRLQDRDTFELGGNVEAKWYGRPERLEENSLERLIEIADAILEFAPNDDPWPVRLLTPTEEMTDYAWLSRMSFYDRMVPEVPMTFLNDMRPS